MSGMFSKEKAFLQAHRDQLAARYPGQFLLLKGGGVHGAFPTYEQAVSEAARLFGTEPCLVRSVQQPEDPPPLFIPALSLDLPLSSR